MTTTYNHVELIENIQSPDPPGPNKREYIADAHGARIDNVRLLNGIEPGGMHQQMLTDNPHFAYRPLICEVGEWNTPPQTVTGTPLSPAVYGVRFGYTALTGTLAVGTTVTGGTSGATGTITGHDTYYKLMGIRIDSGTPVSGETLANGGNNVSAIGGLEFSGAAGIFDTNIAGEFWWRRLTGQYYNTLLSAQNTLLGSYFPRTDYLGNTGLFIPRGWWRPGGQLVIVLTGTIMTNGTTPTISVALGPNTDTFQMASLSAAVTGHECVLESAALTDTSGTTRNMVVTITGRMWRNTSQFNPYRIVSWHMHVLTKSGSTELNSSALVLNGNDPAGGGGALGWNYEDQDTTLMLRVSVVGVTTIAKWSIRSVLAYLQGGEK